MIECRSLTGDVVTVPQESLQFRISVYGVALHEDAALFLRGRTSKRLWFPGGSVSAGEPMTEALRREFQEECGIDVVVHEFLTLREEFFYHDVWRKAFHSIRCYFRCTPCSTELVADDNVLDDESETPRWLPVATLGAADMDEAYGMEVLAQASEIRSRAL